MQHFIISVLRPCLLAVLLATSAMAQAQTRFGLSPEAFAVYQRWVLSTCIGGDELTLAAELRQHASELVPAFQKASAEGPTAQELRDVRAAADENYERRAKFPLEDIRITGVDAAALERFRSVPRQSFVDDQLRRFATGYRANAVAALGTIGDPRSRAFLASLARNGRNPLAAAAQEALRKPRETR